MPHTAVLEIRTYRLHAGSSEAFDRVVRERAVPLLHEFDIDVVRTAPSEQDDGGEHYVLMRAFDDYAQWDAQEQRFYGSPEWQDGPRDDVLGAIESYHTVLVTLPRTAIDGLRAS